MSADLPPYTHMITMLSQNTTRSGAVSVLQCFCHQAISVPPNITVIVL
jgi:hypothetical protein